MRKICTRKDWIKVIRSIFEWIVILLILALVIKAIFVTSVYLEYDHEDKKIVTGKDCGFITISYMGINRTRTKTLVGQNQLREQLKALKDLGYVTITQQDILDYYEKGEKLPEKALYLIFEDGRRDTAIFSQDILVDMNYKATMCTYANKLEAGENKFLESRELITMDESTFWENGSNGYRLSFINVFDRYDRYLGQLTAQEFNDINEYIGRDYNHYLMDYIRDEDRLAIESYSMMHNRISKDYTLMKDAYEKGIGYVPKTYVLMHSNTDRFGNNERVSDVNEECMKEMFAMNFNREGFAKNESDTNIYNLSRLQSQAHWYTNHLLMRIWDDLDEEEQKDFTFVDGEKKRKKNWETKEGASEFKKNTIILTSKPNANGLLKLKEEEQYKNIEVETTLQGNVLGEQTIYLRADDELKNSISVTVSNKKLIVKDGDKEIGNIAIDELKKVKYASCEEDNKAALVNAYKARSRAAKDRENKFAYKDAQKKTERKMVKSVDEGAEPYIPEVQLYDKEEYQLQIVLKDDRISVVLDGETAIDAKKVTNCKKGHIYLEAATIDQGYSQRNLADDVYDAVFKDFIYYQDNSQEGNVIYSNQLEGFEKISHFMMHKWNTIVDWFILNL